jgi:hypothetical protein
MSNPLVVLREYALGQRELTEKTTNGVDTDHQQTCIVFGDIAYQRKAKTNLKVKGKTNEYYSIESLLLLWQNRNLAHTAYVKEAASIAIQPVSRPDRYHSIFQSKNCFY